VKRPVVEMGWSSAEQLDNRKVELWGSQLADKMAFQSEGWMVPPKAENSVRHWEILSVDLRVFWLVEWTVFHWVERRDNDSAEQKEPQKVGHWERQWVD
jgi:hypothetical protein